MLVTTVLHFQSPGKFPAVLETVYNQRGGGLFQHT